MNKTAHILFPAFAFLVLLCKPGTVVAQTAVATVAVVDGRDITASQFSEALQMRLGSRQGKGDAATEKKQLFTEMIRQELLFAAAIKEDYEQRPEIREAIRQLLIRTYREEKLAVLLNKVTVSEEELADSYRSHAAELITPDRRRMALIEIRVPVKTTGKKREELRQRAEQARSEALALPATATAFSSVAVNFSDDQSSRYRGGEIDWLAREHHNSRWSGVVMDSLFSLAEPGLISPVLETPDGFYLVKLLEIDKSSLRPLSTIKEQLRRQLLENKRAQIANVFYLNLQKDISVTINEQVLENIDLPAPITVKPPPMPGR